MAWEERWRTASTVFVVQRRFLLVLLVAISRAALVLAAIGIYGLTRYSVATRTREISIRTAVGAQRRDIVRWMIDRVGLTPSLTGTALWVWQEPCRSGMCCRARRSASQPQIQPSSPACLGAADRRINRRLLRACAPRRQCEPGERFEIRLTYLPVKIAVESVDLAHFCGIRPSSYVVRAFANYQQTE